MEFRHEPVLLAECIEGLAIEPDGAYLDGTLGGGGHSEAILQRISGGALYGIDRDEDAIAAAVARLGKNQSFHAIHGNFHDAKKFGLPALDGALLDLGVSSHQLDVRERGFSYHDDAPLDMRMDRSQPFSARDIVNGWSERDIARILRDYGEENWAAHIAKVLVDRRPIETTGQLANIIDAAIPKKLREKEKHPARRTFQALRIAVNDELEPLEQALRDIVDLLKPKGRLCVIAFHSLEDRIVKNTFRSLADPCTCPKNIPICVCGKKPVAKLITRKPITATEEELERNPRSRSATLRIVEKSEEP
ncbi:MAG: 16S rRNA (cytosine(1402)-N(4))-methyltransferase RsmH [Christensenellales bacterium]